jgi:hypothetical protein
VSCRDGDGLVADVGHGDPASLVFDAHKPDRRAVYVDHRFPSSCCGSMRLGLTTGSIHVKCLRRL